MSEPIPHEPPVDEGTDTGVPGFRTWRSIYLFVLGCFVGCVVIFTIFTRVFG